ncbi:hypothetical protein H4S06_000912 [Coemansia sp. BCRC 34490]|nr:hypothetical protein H4S06_000912 [Coemansia sp. BCRC 34490]
MLVLLDTPNNTTLSFTVSNGRPLEDLAEQTADTVFGDGISQNLMYVTGMNGMTATEAVCAVNKLQESGEGEQMVRLCLRGRLFGGKGGFGSILRSQGNRMTSNKPESYDDCRDLYGRRLKTLKEAKTLVDKLEAEEEARETIKERRRKKIQDGLRDQPTKKHRFDDVVYTKNCEQIVEATKLTTRKAMKRKQELGNEKKQQLGATEASGSGKPSSELFTVPLFDGDIADLSDSSTSSGDGNGDDGESDKEEQAATATADSGGD